MANLTYSILVQLQKMKIPGLFWSEENKILGLAITELSKVWNPLVSWTNFVWENGGSFIYKNSVSFVAGISHISRNKRETLQSYKNIIEYNKNL